MKIKSIAIALIISIAGNAQTLPGTAPKPIQKPVPQVQQLKKLPDLTVSIKSISSPTYKAASNDFSIKVVIEIKNRGTATANNIKISGHIEHAALPALEHTYFHRCDNEEAIVGIEPGGVVTKTIVFTKQDVPGTPSRSYRFRVEADADNTIEELNETNNRSAIADIVCAGL